MQSRVRIRGLRGADCTGGRVIESSSHTSKSGARKNVDAHGLAGVPQFLVQLDSAGDEDGGSSVQDVEKNRQAPSSSASSGLSWHTAEELVHAEHVLEIIGDGMLSQWTAETPPCAVHFVAHRKVSSVSDRSRLHPFETFCT